MKYFSFKETSNKGWMLCPNWDAFWSEGQSLSGALPCLAREQRDCPGRSGCVFVVRTAQIFMGKNTNMSALFGKNPTKNLKNS